VIPAFWHGGKGSGLGEMKSKEAVGGRLVSGIFFDQSIAFFAPIPRIDINQKHCLLPHPKIGNIHDFVVSFSPG
jgi:hypothetical protein